MKTLSPAEQNFLADFVIDQQMVGPQVGKGAEHIVRMYGSDQVIKYQRWDVCEPWQLGPLRIRRDFVNAIKYVLIHKTPADVIENHQLCTEFLPADVVADLQILRAQTSEQFVLLQQFEPHQELTRSHLHLEGMKERIQGIIEGARAMYQKTGLVLDLSGFSAQGLVNCDLKNLGITNDGAVRLYDQTCFGRGVESSLIKRIHFAILQRWQAYVASAYRH